MIIDTHKRRRKDHTAYQRHGDIPNTLLASCLLILVCLLPSTLAASQCLRFADAVTINQLFTDGGPGTKVLLCPSKIYRIAGTISFTAADQELATFGYPTGAERATLMVDSGLLATAIQGDCRRCARISISNLIIDGNRRGLGRMVDYDPSGLIVIGGNEGQAIRRSKILDPRGFTAIHVREGDKRSCTGAIIEKNEIGPVGNEYDPAVDGDDPEMSPIGRPLADGVSIACRDSFVRDNTFIDNTAAAIVVYCSPGTLVQGNRISAHQLSVMGGILMVDATPFEGDYSKMVVKSNIIDAASRTIRVGIGIGAAVWSDDIDTILKGGSVIANSFKGNYMGYSIAAAGLNGWTIKDNYDDSVHQGKQSARCFDEPINPDPTAFLYYGDTVKESDIQSGFVNSEFQYVVCIDGLEDSSNPPKPVTTTPAPIEDRAEAVTPDAPVEPVASPDEPEMFATGSEVMDDILEHSQQRMLEALYKLRKRVDGIAKRKPHSLGLAGSGANMAFLTEDLSAVMMSLNERVEAIEEKQRSFVQLVTQLRRDIKRWDEGIDPLNRWQADAILSIQKRLYVFFGHTPADMEIDRAKLDSRNSRNAPEMMPGQTDDDKPGAKSETKATTKRSTTKRITNSFGSFSGLLHILLVSIVIGGMCEIGKRYWSARRTHRKIM